MTRRLLAGLYAVLASVLAAYLAWAMPPFQGADEDNQFLRAVQVSQGGVVAARLPDGVLGGRLPVGADRLAHGFADLHGLAAGPVAVGRVRADRGVGWGEAGESGFANMAVYPALFYLPGAAAIRVGRWFGASVLSGLWMARAANAVVAIGIGGVAILVAEAGGLWLFWVLSLPMSVALMASCSQDGVLIAVAALVAGLLSRWGRAEMAVPFRRWVGLAVAIGCLGAARPPYLALAILPAAWAGGYGLWRRAGLVAVPVGIGLGWLWFGARPVMFPTGMAAQAAMLVRHPGRLPLAFWETGRHFGVTLCTEFAGVLGWLDVPLRTRAYLAALLVLAVVLGLEWPGHGVSRVRLSAGAVAVLGCCFGLGLVLYLDWTPVGAAVIEGLQGRYFIPAAMFLAPSFGRRVGYPRWLWVVLPVWALADLVWVRQAVEAHYWVGRG